MLHEQSLFKTPHISKKETGGTHISLPPASFILEMLNFINSCSCQEDEILSHLPMFTLSHYL